MVDAAVVLAYLVLCLILLYPFIVDLQGRIPGDGGDGYQGLWNLWWVRKAVLDLHINPYHTYYLYYPVGADLLVHTLSPLAGILTIPLQLTLGLIFAYNFIVILSFVAGGYGAYLLSKYLTKSRGASFFAGLVFGFSPYHFAHTLGHMNLISLEWIPFYVLFLLKMQCEKSLRNVLYATLSLLMATFMGDLEYALMLALFTVFFLFYHLIADRKSLVNRGFLTRLLLMVLSFLVVASPIVVPLFNGTVAGKYGYAERELNDWIVFSADLIGFSTPSPLNSLFGTFSVDLVSRLSKDLSVGNWISENTTYIGYSVLSLVGYAVLKNRQPSKFWLSGALLFMIFSLGPFLHVMGLTKFTAAQWNAPLPGILLYYLPFVRAFRTPARFHVITTLCLAVISALSLKDIMRRLGKAMFRAPKAPGLLLLPLLSGILLAEYSNTPYPMCYDMNVPRFYYEMWEMPYDFAILDLPAIHLYHHNSGQYMYYGTIAGKRLVSGSISRPTPRNLKFLNSIPIVAQTESLAIEGDLLVPYTLLYQNARVANLNALRAYGIKYVIVHTRFLYPTTNLAKLTTYLESFLGPPVYSDEEIIGYETPSFQLPSVYAFLMDGWHNPEYLGGVVTEWIQNKTSIEVFTNTPLTAYLRFYVRSDDDATVKVFLNDKHVTTFSASTSRFARVLISLDLLKGSNQVMFSSKQGYHIAFQDITISDSV